MQARSSSSESEAMLGIVHDTEEKSQKDQVVAAVKPSKPLVPAQMCGVPAAAVKATVMCAPIQTNPQFQIHQILMHGRPF